MSLFDQKIDMRNNPGDIKLFDLIFDLIEIWCQLIDLKFDLVLKSAFEQVKGANKPAKCGQQSMSSQIRCLMVHGSAKNLLKTNMLTQFIPFRDFFLSENEPGFS